MLKFLYSWFSWVPVFGSIVKAAYIGSLVAQLKLAASRWAPNPKVAKLAGRELDEALSEEARTLVTELMEASEAGDLATIVTPAAVGAMVPLMRKQVLGG